jgi:hypothetical protein
MCELGNKRGVERNVESFAGTTTAARPARGLGILPVILPSFSFSFSFSD